MESKLTGLKNTALEVSFNDVVAWHRVGADVGFANLLAYISDSDRDAIGFGASVVFNLLLCPCNNN